MGEHVGCKLSDEFTHAELVNAYGVLDEGVLVARGRGPHALELVVTADGAETETRLSSTRSAQPITRRSYLLRIRRHHPRMSSRH